MILNNSVDTRTHTHIVQYSVYVYAYLMRSVSFYDFNLNFCKHELFVFRIYAIIASTVRATQLFDDDQQTWSGTTTTIIKTGHVHCLCITYSNSSVYSFGLTTHRDAEKEMNPYLKDNKREMRGDNCMWRQMKLN